MTDSQAHQAIIRVADAQRKLIQNLAEMISEKTEIIEACADLIENIAAAPHDPAAFQKAKRIQSDVNTLLKLERRPQKMGLLKLPF